MIRPLGGALWVGFVGPIRAAGESMPPRIEVVPTAEVNAQRSSLAPTLEPMVW